MSGPEVHVYAKCWSGRRNYLQKLYTGTRSQCKTFVKSRAMQGLPTHFIEVSSLELLPATKKLCDGARFDEFECCYYD